MKDNHFKEIFATHGNLAKLVTVGNLPTTNLTKIKEAVNCELNETIKTIITKVYF